jgi:predicted DNA-binding protein YlxM (UPF0122 family)
MARSRAYNKIQRVGRESRAFGGVPLGDEIEVKIDLLRTRVEMLAGVDRVLMEMYLNGNGSLSQMAVLAGVTETSIARHIRSLVGRLLDDSYMTCLRSRDKLTDVQIEMAKDYFVGNLSMREIAEKNNTTSYFVIKTIRKIRRITAVG